MKPKLAGYIALDNAQERGYGELFELSERRQFQHGSQKRMNDICANRHKGNEESQAAFVKIKDRLSVAQYNVWRVIVHSGSHGLTVDEIAVKLQTTPNAISGRVTELKIAGKIRKNGTRLTRGGCSAAVLVAV